MRRALRRLSARQHRPAVAPGDRLAGDQQRLAGRRACTTSRSCSTATTVRLSSCQRRTRSSRSAVVLASIAVNGSSSRITPGVLQQQAREQRPLHLPARQGRDRPPLEADEADGRDAPPRSACAIPRGRCRRTGRAATTGPSRRGRRRRSERCGRDRRPAAGRRCRRACSPPTSSMPPASGCNAPTMPLSRVDLPAPFGPTTADQAAGRDLAVEMVHGRMAVIAERHVIEPDGRRRAHAQLKREPRSPEPRAPREQRAPPPDAPRPRGAGARRPEPRPRHGSVA